VRCAVQDNAITRQNRKPVTALAEREREGLSEAAIRSQPSAAPTKPLSDSGVMFAVSRMRVWDVLGPHDRPEHHAQHWHPDDYHLPKCLALSIGGAAPNTENSKQISKHHDYSQHYPVILSSHVSPPQGYRISVGGSGKGSEKFTN